MRSEGKACSFLFLRVPGALAPTPALSSPAPQFSTAVYFHQVTGDAGMCHTTPRRACALPTRLQESWGQHFLPGPVLQEGPPRKAAGTPRASTAH